MDTADSRPEILGSFEMWRWRRKEKIVWTERLKKVLRRVKEKRNMLYIKRTKAKQICHILTRKCYLQRVIGGKRRDEKTRKKT